MVAGSACLLSLFDQTISRSCFRQALSAVQKWRRKKGYSGADRCDKLELCCRCSVSTVRFRPASQDSFQGAQRRISQERRLSTLCFTSGGLMNSTDREVRSRTWAVRGLLGLLAALATAAGLAAAGPEEPSEPPPRKAPAVPPGAVEVTTTDDSVL